MKKFFSLIMVTSTLFSFTSCGKSITSKITDNAINQFLEITKIPRPAYCHEPMLNYLSNFAKAHSFNYASDTCGNFWMDVPATKGYETKPKIILQAHTDMVCEHEKDYPINFQKDGLTPVIDDKNHTITAYKTSLGADDGIGIAMALAIATSDIPHGPIRTLFTADEEVGLIGANSVSNEVIDSDYLINIDGENENEIVYSSAGHLIARHNKVIKMQSVPSTDKKISILISGLMGGHSGIDIDKNRLSAVTVVTELFNSFSENKIDYEICDMDGGGNVNAIATSAKTTIAIDSSKYNAVEEIIKEVTSNFKSAYPNEDLKIEIADINNDAKCLSLDESKNFISLLSSFSFHQGVIKKDGDRVITSSNTGTFMVNDSFCEIGTCSRSHVTADLDSMENEFKANDEKCGYKYIYGSSSPGWDGDPNIKLIALLKEGYSESYTDTKLSSMHAGLECSWLSSKRKGIQIACLGAQISDAHTTKETLYLDTIEPCVKAIVHAIKKLADLN
ncbi:MAG: beta-Ala-His dipeptidase [Bacilli bacterium]|nr:beta-Ala-His dipeptidase [Bacilli bacterium]